MKNTITQHLKNKSFYLIGIGGAGMMGIAELLHNLGFTVHGSDIVDSPSVKRLRELKIKVCIGHDSSKIKPNDIIIYSNAIKSNNIEIKYARENSMTILTRMEMLSELMRLKYGISITGSHGKTTTTSLLSHILHDNNLDPTYLIGGMLKTDDPHVKLGNSNYLITETDESDPNFTILKPHLVVLTNLDSEHLENYGDSFENLKKSMQDFINSIPFYGQAFINGDDLNSINICKKINRDIFTFGLKNHNHLYAKNIILYENKMKFKLIYNNRAYSLETNLIGNHNVYNILAAISVCLHLDIKITKVIQSVSTFFGVSRRLDIHQNIQINKKDIITIDDYGHHPTEIKSTLETIKKIYPKRNIIMVFQPHRYSRTKSSWSCLVKVLNSINTIILLPTYSAGEKKTIYDSKFLYKKLTMKNKIYVRTIEKVIDVLKLKIDSKSILLLQGAGDIKNIINILYKNETK
jgi:UDP-N-acetylmuramate--alanine ligase